MRQMIYPVPPMRVPSPPPAPIEEVEVRTPAGDSVSAWHVAAGEGSAGRPAIVWFHGNGENLETMRLGGLFRDLGGLDAALLAVDYPGYGRSPGTPSEAANHAAAAAALDWLVARYPDRPKVACGWSLGAAVAVRLAADRGADLRGLAVASPWTRLEEVARLHFPQWLVGMAGMALKDEVYDSLAAASRIEVPSLVIHGRRDEIIPVEQGRRLASGLRGSRWVEVESAGHNDLLAEAVVWRELRAWVDEVAAGVPRSAGPPP